MAMGKGQRGGVTFPGHSLNGSTKIHLGAPSFELERSPSGMVLAIVPEGKQGNRKHQQSQRGCAHLDNSGC